MSSTNRIDVGVHDSDNSLWLSRQGKAVEWGGEDGRCRWSLRQTRPQVSAGSNRVQVHRLEYFEKNINVICESELLCFYPVTDSAREIIGDFLFLPLFTFFSVFVLLFLLFNFYLSGSFTFIFLNPLPTFKLR